MQLKHETPEAQLEQANFLQEIPSTEMNGTQ